MSVLINASTTSGLVQTADTSGTLELQSNGTTQLTVSSTGAYGQLKSGTAQASTSGTSIDFTGLPSWVKRITVLFKAVSTNGSSPVMVQLGDAGGIETTGYSGSVDFVEDNAAGTTFSTGFNIDRTLSASDLRTGQMTIVLFGSNNWNETSLISTTLTTLCIGAGDKTLSDTLDRIRITTVNGTDAFDAGSINILYEG